MARRKKMSGVKVSGGTLALIGVGALGLGLLWVATRPKTMTPTRYPAYPGAYPQGTAQNNTTAAEIAAGAAVATSLIDNIWGNGPSTYDSSNND